LGALASPGDTSWYNEILFVGLRGRVEEQEEKLEYYVKSSLGHCNGTSVCCTGIFTEMRKAW
jgi:hypothetical protein